MIKNIIFYLDIIHSWSKLCYWCTEDIKVLFSKAKNQSISFIFWWNISCSFWMANCWNVVRNLWIYTLIQVILILII